MLLSLGLTEAEAKTVAKTFRTDTTAQTRAREVAALCRVTGNWHRAPELLAANVTLREAQAKLRRADPWAALGAKAWAARHAKQADAR